MWHEGMETPNTNTAKHYCHISKHWCQIHQNPVPTILITVIMSVYEKITAAF